MGDRFFRVDIDFSWHPKTIELERQLQHPGAGGFVVNLWCWAAIHRPGGALSNMTSRDLSTAVRWPGDPEKLVAALLECGGEGPGFLEEVDGVLILHDWREKQEYFAQAEERWRGREKKRRQRLSPKRPPGKGDKNGTKSHACPPTEGDMAGTMSPQSPPLEKRREDQRREDQDTPPTPQRGMDGFDAFWKLYPKHAGKKAALKAWTHLNPSPNLQDRILAAIRVQLTWPQWTKEGGQFIPHPTTWLNQARWDDESPTPLKEHGADLSRFKKLMEDENGDKDPE